MNKLLVGLQAVALLALGYMIYDAKFNSATSVPSDFNITADNMALDVVGQSVTLPGGVVWGFNQDQQISVKPFMKKGSDGAVLVYAELSATVKFQPPKEDKKDAKDAKDKPASPKSATMTGMAKFYYERVQGGWYLVHLESVNLKFTAHD